MGNTVSDNIKLAIKNSLKNIEITKPLVKIDWSTIEKNEKKVKLITINLENNQV